MGSVVGVDGGVDAVRRSLYQPMRPDQLPDFVLPLTVVEQGYRVVYVPEAVLEEETLTSESAEYRMRVRVALRAFWALWDKRTSAEPAALSALQLAAGLPQAPAVPELCAAWPGCRDLNWLLVPQSAGSTQCWPPASAVPALLALLALRGPARCGGFL